MKKQWSCLLLGAVAFVSHAQSEQAQPKMIVTANRMAESTDKVLAPYTVVTADDIERMQASSVVEVLTMQPGLEVRANGGRGHSTSVSIRGGAGAAGKTLVLLNGARLMSSTLGQADIDFLPASIVERIEIIRGPRAGQYGADAMNGVINIITRPEEGSVKNRLSAGIGQHGYAQGSWNFVQPVGENTQVHVALNREQGDGYNITPDNPPGHDYGFRTEQELFSVAHQFNDLWRGSFNAFSSMGHSEYDGNGGMDENSYIAKMVVNQQIYQGKLEYQGERYQSNIDINYGIDDSRNLSLSPSKTVTRRYALNWLNHYIVSSEWSVDAGLDAAQDDVGKSSAKYDETKRYNVAAYTGVAFEQGPYQVHAALRQDHNQRYNNHTTYSLAGGWFYLPHHQVKLSYSTAFKAPSFNYLYYPGLSNPNLKPEKSKNLELGFVGDTLGVGYELNIYRMWYRELISSNAPTWIPRNTAKANISGAELILTGNTGPIEQKLSYVYQYGENQQHHQLAYVPQHTVKWQMDWPIASWNLHTGLDWTGKRYSSEANTDQMPSYLTVNIAAGYQVTEKLKLKASVHNLLNRDYETVADYKAPGIETRLNATYDF